jgi:hypothetical protein
MASNYRIKISGIDNSHFSCNGCSSFQNYVTKRGLTVYDSAYVDLADLVTQHNLTSTAVTNTNGYHNKFTKNGTTVCRGVMKTNLSSCGSLAGWVSLPLFSNTTAVDPILPGTIPRFNLKTTLGPGTYTLKLANGSLTVNNTTITAEDGKPPLFVLLVMQGAGGGGGGGTSHQLGTGWWHGAGGGSGAAAVVLLDLSSAPEWTLKVGSAGYAGSGGVVSTSGNYSSGGGRGGETKISSGSQYITCSGGGGGGSFGNILDEITGGSAGTVTHSSTGNNFQLLASKSGAKAKADGDKAGDVSAMSCTYGSSSIFTNVTYSTPARTGGSAAGSGAPSAHAAGNSGSGAGGNGGDAGLFSNSNGSAGGAGFIKIYY